MKAPFGAENVRRRPGINIAPMIDVMFLLLIFFMVSSTFREQIGIDVSLPSSTSSTTQEEQPNRLTVRADGAFFWQGEEITPEVLEETLGILVKETPELAVVLRADEAASFQDVIRAMDIVRNVGGAQLIIPTQNADAIAPAPVQ